MAEKEERIMIVADKPYYCNSCNKVNNCSKDCKGYIEWFNRPDPIRHFYSKSEAIERMEKALFKVDNVLALDIEFEQLTKRKQLAYKVFAEAALNALLEAK